MQRTIQSNGQSFPATDKSIGKELTKKFKAAGGGVEWKRADLLKEPEDKEPFHLFNKVGTAVLFASLSPVHFHAVVLCSPFSVCRAM